MLTSIDLPSTPVVVLDANVLWSSTGRDFLLSLAESGAFVPRWSAGILGEIQHEDHRNRLCNREQEGRAATGAAHLVSRMRETFPRAELPFERDMERTVVLGDEGAEFVIDPDRMTDPNDAHVVAAAIAARADAIITNDRHGFETEQLPPCVRVFDDASFATWLATEVPLECKRALRDIVGHTSMSVGDILTKFEHDYGWATAVRLLRGPIGLSTNDRSTRREPGVDSGRVAATTHSMTRRWVVDRRGPETGR